jgi:3-dehydroquinate dehydratase / shikimate dehydrogenase
LKRLFLFVPKPLLCATVTAPTMADLRRRRDAVTAADLVELRLDTVADPDPAGALADRRRPVIVTCRARWEGGQFGGSEDERKAILSRASALGADFVDVEWRAHFDDLIAARHGRGIVLSTHDFDGMPADLDDRLRAMRATGAEIVKLAVTPLHLSDCIALLNLGAQEGRKGGLILIGMGDRGLATRILAGRFASAWTYAGSVREVGQVSVASLVDDYRFHSIGDATQLYGIAAGSVAHSISPAMHNAAFRASGLDAVYVPLAATSADDFLMFARALGLKGASVTIPHKVALYERMDEVDTTARQIGAVNTIRFGERTIGTNTDAIGFLRALQARVAAAELIRLRASVVGAGGAARAVITALAAAGCVVRVHARNESRAAAIAAATATDVGPWPPRPGSWDLLVNCTPLGMVSHVEETPVPAPVLTGRYVYDLVYNPPVTRLLRDAAAMGCATIGGLDMLVEQALEQFRWWTGATASPAVMREAALARLQEFARDEDYVV